MNLEPYVNKFSIIDKRGKQQLLQPNWAQKRYLAAIEEQARQNQPLRVIVLKARQLGISTVTEAVIFALSMMWEHSRALIVSHEKDSAEHLLSITRLFWETYPFRSLYTPRRLSRMELGWEENDSQIRIATAKNLAAGRSMTIRLVHGSEVAQWQHAETLMGGLVQAIPTVPNSFFALESTAQGVGNYFHREWVAAEGGDSEFVPLFFPWFHHPEYKASHINIPHAALGPLDNEERILRKVGVDDDSLAWRRYAIAKLCRSDIKIFHEEYPSTPEEAFIATGTNVFPYKKVLDCYDPIDGDGLRGRLERDGARVVFAPDTFGPLTLYRKPSRKQPYIVGGDPTRTVLGDPACAQVLNRVTFEQIATWHGRIDPVEFAEELVKLAIYFNEALIAPESTGPGQSTIGALLNIGYPHVWQRRQADRTPGQIQSNWGWDTSRKTKFWAIGGLLHMIVDNDILLHDSGTKEELVTYVTYPGGEMGPADKDTQHDDRVMALAIAVACNLSEGPQFPLTVVDADSDEPPWLQWVEDAVGTGIGWGEQSGPRFRAARR